MDYFGSSVKFDSESNSIDICVNGIELRLFFDFYAELFKNLSKLPGVNYLILDFLCQKTAYNSR